MLMLYPDEEDPDMFDEDFQFLLATHIAKDEEQDALYKNDEINPVPDNGRDEILQERT